MGGYGATTLGAKHPDLFGAIVEYSGALAEWSDMHAGAKHEMFNDDIENFKPFPVWEIRADNIRGTTPRENRRFCNALSRHVRLRAFPQAVNTRGRGLRFQD